MNDTTAENKAEKTEVDRPNAVAQNSRAAPSADAGDDIPAAVTFSLSAPQVLALFPHGYVAESLPAPSLQDKILITVYDVASQLSKGKVTMSVAQLALFVPSLLLMNEARSDTTTLVSLPLPAVVNAVGVDRLGRNIARIPLNHRYRIDRIGDPFRQLFSHEYDRRPVFSLQSPLEIPGAVPHLEERLPLPETLAEGHTYLLTLEYQATGRARAFMLIKPQDQKHVYPIRDFLPDAPEPKIFEHRFTPSKECQAPILGLWNWSAEGLFAVTQLTLQELVPKAGL